jgi:hypothetical protein
MRRVPEPDKEHETDALAATDPVMKGEGFRAGAAPAADTATTGADDPLGDPDELPKGVSEAHIGGYPGPFYTVRWDDRRLLYEARDQSADFEIVELEPTEGDFKNFWRSMNRIGVWDWAPRYAAEDVSDGTGWSVVLEHEGSRLESDGDNAFPLGFEAFLRAVSRLAGGRPFR